MTTRRADYFLQIFKTIGAPLVGAALSRAQGEGADPKAVAASVAELLTKSVQLGIDIGALAELEKQGDKAESARIAMTGLAGDMLGGWYALQGKMPEPADLQRITEGLRTVKEFTANFEASDQATMRLESIKAKGQDVDALQSQIQIFHGFIPVIEALTTFPLAQSGAQTVQDIVENLTQKVAPVAAAIAGQDDQSKRLERGLLACAASLYAQCHEAEGQAALAQSQPLSPERIWQRFDVQLQILEALSQSIVPGDSAPAPTAAPPPPASPASPPPPASPSPPPPPAAEEPEKKPQIFSGPIQQPAEDLSPPESAITPPPAPQTPPPPPVQSEPPPAAGGNPMSFFTKKPADETEAPPPPQESPPQAPPPPPVQAAPTPEAEPPPPIPQEEIPPPPAEPPHGQDADAQDDDSSSSTGGNPMSFFTKKKSDDGEEGGS